MQSSFFTTSWYTVFNQLTLGISSKKRQNMRNYFSIFFSNTQVKTLISQPLFYYESRILAPR
ncbi:hypothetical protein B1180_07095 [Enterococcus faecium]|nr:hypothetical protein B1180_07095 [Enterococcus faecium]